MVRDLAFGLISVAVLMWLMFFAGPGTGEVATLAAAAVALVWFATVDPSRLVDERGRPQAMLFGLAGLAGGLLLTAATLFSSSTTFLTLGAGVTAFVTGLVRAVRHGLNDATEES
jgi:hypothetical protein